jgi:hypothetical protein
MQFLRSEFIDQLRAEIDHITGNVVIEAAQFTPQQILEFNNETFELAFREWSETRKEQRIEKAEQILSLHGNRERFGTLSAVYSRGTVLPFVGAGLSIPAGYPGWTGYLYQLREETTVAEVDLTRLMGSGEYEEAAQLLFDAMPHDSFNEDLENKFGNDKNLEGCVRFLPYCFPQSSVVTTNFDDVVKRCYQAADKHFTEELLGADAVELPHYLAQGKNVLVKLHGKASAARNRILTKQEYDRHYVEGKTLSNSVEALAKNTLLFLGCSLGSDRTVKCLKSLFAEKGAASAVRHYAFLAVGDDKDERIRRRNELAEANIFPIWYPADDDHDECLMALLTKLAENSGGTQ